MKPSLQIPQIVRFHRKKATLTQAELARLSGVGKTVVFDLEKGKVSIQLDSLLKVLHVLNISLNLDSPLMEEFNSSRKQDDEKS